MVRIDVRAAGAAGRLSLAAASVGFGQSAVLALVPVAAERTGLDAAAIGGVAFAGAVAFLVCAPAWGSGTGWRLRRLFAALAALMALGHGLFALALTLPALPAAAALALLLAARIAYGAGAAGVMPHAQAALMGAVAEAGRPAALGRLGAGLSAGRILGSLVMSVGVLGTGAPLVVLAASPLLLLAAPDLASAPKAEPAKARRGGILRAAGPLLGIGFALTLGLGQVQIVLGLFLQQRFGLDAAGAAGLAGATFALVAVAMILTQLVLVPRLGGSLRRNLGLGLAGFAAGAGLIACAPAPWLAGLGAVLAGAGIALATPHYTAALVARVPAQAQAAAAGWLASVHVLGQGIGALCGGAAFRIAPALPFWTCAALGLALTLAAARLPPEAPDHPAP